jgi:hypothetical protein
MNDTFTCKLTYPFHGTEISIETIPFAVELMWFERRLVRVSIGGSHWMSFRRPPAGPVSAPPVVLDSTNFPPESQTTTQTHQGAFHRNYY